MTVRAPVRSNQAHLSHGEVEGLHGNCCCVSGGKVCGAWRYRAWRWFRDRDHPACSPYRALRRRPLRRRRAVELIVRPQATPARVAFVTPLRSTTAPPRYMSLRPVRALTLPMLLMVGACSANGDFDRVKPNLVSDDIHAWVGRDAARVARVPVSKLPLTDEERTLRDLAYPLIEPPFDRARWYAIINEYGLSRRDGWPKYRINGYSEKLMAEHYRSATARYDKLNNDIRDDAGRVPEFFAAGRTVLDLDDKRGKSFAYVSGLTHAEKGNAV